MAMHRISSPLLLVAATQQLHAAVALTVKGGQLRLQEDGVSIAPSDATNIHLVAKGNNRCDNGADVGEQRCGEDGNALTFAASKNPGRPELQTGSWDHVPAGCSVQTGGDWAAHFNRNSQGRNNGDYSLVCTGGGPKIAAVPGCAASYEFAIGDIPGWGEIDGAGGGQTASSSAACASLCDDQVRCLSYEYSPTAKKCNLNMNKKVQTTSAYEDYFFCMKTSGDASAALDTDSPMINHVELSDDMGGSYKFEPRLLDNGVKAWRNGDSTFTSVPDALQGATVFAGNRDQAWTGTLTLRARYAGFAYVWGTPNQDGPLQDGGITKMFWKQVGTMRWQGRDSGSLVIYRRAMKKDSWLDIHISDRWVGGVAFKKDSAAEPLASNMGGVDYMYFGCHETVKLHKAKEYEDALSMTVQRCFMWCSEHQSSGYFGLEDGKKCWCAPLFVGGELAEAQCDSKCDGNPSQKCGGVAGAASVHHMFDCSAPAPPATTTTTSTYATTTQPPPMPTVPATPSTTTTTQATTPPAPAPTAPPAEPPAVTYNVINGQTCGSAGQGGDGEWRPPSDGRGPPPPRGGQNILMLANGTRVGRRQARKASAIQRHTGGKPPRAATPGEYGGTRISINDHYELFAGFRGAAACKEACSNGDGNHECGGFTYQPDMMKCTFVLDPTEGEVSTATAGDQCWSKIFD